MKRTVAVGVGVILAIGAAAPVAVADNPHAVRAGESLSRIAVDHQVSGGWQALHEANRGTVGSDPNRLAVGQVLWIPTPPVPPSVPGDGAGVYVGPGETVKLDAFSSWLGRPVQATDYLDPGWNGNWNPVAVKRWGDWKKAVPGRKFVLGLHLLPEQGGTFSRGLAGQYDQQFRDLARMLKANGLGDSVIRLGYEPNNPNIGPWQGTSSPWSYREMYKRVWRIMEEESPSFKWDYNLAVGRSGWVTSFETLYPGDSYVDIVGLNIYDVWWKHYSSTAWSRWQNTLKAPMGVNEFKAFAKKHNKPVSYPEWGLYKRGDNYAGGGDSTYFIDRMKELTATAQYHAYFNWNWTAYGSDINMFPAGKAKFKERFGQ